MISLQTEILPDDQEFVLLLSQLDDCQIDYIMQIGFLRGRKRNKKYHDHSVWEIHGILDGSARLYVEGKEYTICKNTVVLIPPGRVHCIYEAENAQRMGFRFSYKDISHGGDRGFIKAYFDRVFSREMPFISFDSAEICNAMKQICSGYPGTVSDYTATRLAEHVVLSAAEKILPMPQTDIRVRNREADSIRIVRLEEFINENYERKIRLSDIAKLYHLSEKQTERVICRLFGKNFSALLLEKRLVIACSLLEQTDMPIDDISAATGFGTVSYFYRCFQNAKYMTPCEYRRRNQTHSF